MRMKDIFKEFQGKKIISQGFNPFEQVSKSYLLLDERGNIIQIRQQSSKEIDNKTEFLFIKYKQEGSEYKAYSQGEIMEINLRKSLDDIFKK